MISLKDVVRTHAVVKALAELTADVQAASNAGYEVLTVPPVCGGVHGRQQCGGASQKNVLY